jgi:F-type H+-transporting ATPase subunit delta
MKVTKQAKRDAKSLFRSCRVDGLLDEGRARQAVLAVAAKRPRGYLSVLVHFARLVKLDNERRSARVESALPLNGAQQAQVTEKLTRRYGPGLNISYSHNPALLGGVRIRVGCDVFDASVQARLQSLAEAF